MIRDFTLLIITLILLTGCQANEEKFGPAEYVDPFIGTDAHGHTYPGATTPFGMVQLSPDTGTRGWDWCSGYHSSDSTIIGFSHTHLSGTGGADLGDILFMPANGNLLFSAGSREFPEDGYRSAFSHATELAEPGYYRVLLEDYQTEVELTATPRTGIHRYNFNSREPHHIIIDLTHGIADITTAAYYRLVDSVTVEGYRRSKGWAADHTVYFRAEFSHPFSAFEGEIENTPTLDSTVNGTNLALAILYSDTLTTQLEVQVAISMSSLAGAAANLEAERTTFDTARKQAYQSWNERLNKINIQGATAQEKTIFYTSLYHTMLSPHLMSDADKSFLGADSFKYNDPDVTSYGLFSLWDTFRALHPLFTIIAPAQNQEFIRSIIRYYDQTGRLPVWDLNMNETNCMIGYHAIPVIGDAYMKGQRDFDTEKALEAMIASAMQEDWNGVQYLRTLGYIPSDRESNSVSKALEISYDDWVIAQMAQKMGHEDIYKEYIKRAQYYKNHFDQSDRFFKARNSAGVLNPDFDPTRLSYWGSGDYTEGNAWQYNFFIPQDIQTHIELCGGDSLYVELLDKMFETEGVGGKVSDVTGLIGQYAHGNEPSHHIAYLYSYAGQPWRTQQRVAHIASLMYGAGRDGLCGNEDCGQMSAWYIFSTLGFYPVTPGSDIYVLGTPHFKKATISLENGKKFSIETVGLNDEALYIKSVKYNGKPYHKSYITHQMIMDGGKLIITMSREPNIQFGSAPEDRPISKITDNLFSSEEMLQNVVFEPTISNPSRTFNNSTTIYPTSTYPIHYTINGNLPTKYSPRMSERGITLQGDSHLQMIAVDSSDRSSSATSHKFYRTLIPYTATISGTEPTPPYEGRGLNALIDGEMGGDSFRDPSWLGFTDIEVQLLLELPKKMWINGIKINIINRPGDWILSPKSITVRTSKEGMPLHSTIFTDRERYRQPIGQHLIKLPVGRTSNTLYITLEGGVLPDWHISSGELQWIFVDELIAY